MDEITLKRGSEEVTFKKVPEYFAVRLKQGRATDEVELEAACGKPATRTRHVDSAPDEGLEVFSVEADDLEVTMSELRDASASDVVTHIYSIGDSTDDTSGNVIPTGTMTVQFRADVESSTREEILAEFGLEVLEELDFVDNGYTVGLTEQSTENPLKIAAKLQGRSEIETAEPDLSFQISLKHVPSDSLYPDQWYLNNRGDSLGLVAGADVKAEGAWEHTRGSRDVVVCVMDDGFDLGHSDFDADGKVVSPRDFGGLDFDPNPDAQSDNHGTACAGVAVAEENGTGVVGLAPGCALMPVRTSGWLSDESVRQLFQYAIDTDADVISCSWSAAAWNFPLSTKMHGIIKKAATQGRSNSNGCVILFAAGNEDRPLDGEKDGRRSHQGFALHQNVVAVAASNSRDERSSYSNFGPELSICAPSSGSPGRRITTTDRRGASGYSAGDYTNSFGGTSSSTPLAAGLAALLLSVDFDLTAAEIKHVMMETADQIDEAGGDYVDGHSPWYGDGRINAKAAVEFLVGAGEERLPKTLAVEHRVNLPLPDRDQTVDSIPFPLDVASAAIELSVDIRHTWRGDLRVTVTAPNGTDLVLTDRAGGSRDDFVRTFRSADEPELFSDALGASAAGDWQLTVEDLASQDVGTLVSWGVAVTYE